MHGKKEKEKPGKGIRRKNRPSAHARGTGMAKLERAQGGCLGTGGRRKTRQAAKSCGEGQIPEDPQVSEWGNPRRKSLRTGK